MSTDTTIVLHTPEKIRIPFVRRGSIGLNDVLEAILPILKEDVHQTSDLQLKGVNSSEHLFLVAPDELEKGVYHVLSIPGNDGKLYTFEAIYNEAMDAYGDILGQKLYTSAIYQCDGLMEVPHSSTGYPCGTVFLLDPYSKQEHNAKVSLPAVQDHGNCEDRNSNAASHSPVEHTSLDNSKIPSRENKVDTDTIQLPTLTNEVKPYMHVDAFEHISPEKEGRPAVLHADNVPVHSHIDGTVVIPKKESSNQSSKSKSQKQSHNSPNLSRPNPEEPVIMEKVHEDSLAVSRKVTSVGGGNLLHETEQRSEEGTKTTLLLHAGADCNPQQSIKEEDMIQEISASKDNLENGNAVIAQPEDDHGGGLKEIARELVVSPASDALNDLKSREKKVVLPDNLELKRLERALEHQATYSLSPQDLRQVQYLEHVYNGVCSDQNLCKEEHCSPSFLEGIAQMKDLVQQERGGCSQATTSLKPYILLHYPRCPGSVCMVPHLAAGCPAASDDRTTSTISTTFSQSENVDSSVRDEILRQSISGRRQQTHGIDISFDSQPANITLTPEDQNCKNGATQIEAHRQATNDLDDVNQPMSTKWGPPHDALSLNRPQGVIDRMQHSQNAGVQNRENIIPRLGRLHICESDLALAQLQAQSKATGRTAFQDKKYKDPESGPSEMALYPENTLQHQNNLKVYPPGIKGIDIRHTIEQQGRTVAGNGSSRVGDVVRQAVPSVKDNGFLLVSVYDGLRSGTIIFSREDCFTVGLSYSLPNIMDHSLGKGGNGKVTLHVVNNKVFAVKKTNYRSKELNSWVKLSHRNLIPLLAVMIVPAEKCCYQFMPKMKESLNSVIMRQGTLKELSCGVTSEEWKLISFNILYILKSVLKGLQYLQEQNMQHCDVKANNVLIGVCPCPEALYCSCSEPNKFQVLLADFDSMKETEMSVNPATLPMVDFIQYKGKIMGTPGYRAPEQFSSPKLPHTKYERTIMDGRVKYKEEKVNCGGPWCDVWSFGVMTARICFHKPRDTTRDANIIRRCPSAPNEITVGNENIHALVVLQRLTKAALADENLRSFALLASQCQEPKFRDRLKAKEVLKYLETQIFKNQSCS